MKSKSKNPEYDRFDDPKRERTVSICSGTLSTQLLFEPEFLRADGSLYSGRPVKRAIREKSLSRVNTVGWPIRCAPPAVSAFGVLTFLLLLSRFTRKCTSQGNGGYVTCWAVRLVRIASEIFLNYANGLNSRHSMGHAGHPVPSRSA